MAALYLGFIGDSITAGYGLIGAAPPALTAATLTTAAQTVTAVNQGVNGATTADWVLTGDGKPLTNALIAFDAQGVTTVLIMLGTNDAKPAGVSPAVYQANLAQIIDTLKANGITRVILNQPPPMQPSDTGYPDTAAENEFLQMYQGALTNLAAGDPGHVFVGDRLTYGLFAIHPEYYQADGIHPNDTGAAALAQRWADGYTNIGEGNMANDPIIQPSTGGTAATWGSITGTLSSQTDLQSALNAKSPAASPTFTGTVALPATTTVPGTSVAVIKPAADDANAKINIYESDGTTIVACFDLHQRRVGIGTATPAKLLQVAGNANIDGVLAMGVTNASAACLIDMVNPFVGLGIPAMTTAQKLAISPHRAGNMVFDTDLSKACVDNGVAWETITSV